MKLVEDARKAWRWFSMQCMAGAVAVQGAWEMVPAEMKAGLSDKHVRYVTVTLLVLGIIGRLLKQGEK